ASRQLRTAIMSASPRSSDIGDAHRYVASVPKAIITTGKSSRSGERGLFEMSATAASAATRIGATLISAACFTWVALFNGYPLVYSDTGAYLAAGIEYYIPNERPIFYGIFMIPLHLDGWSLWPVVIGQCLILAYVLRLILRVLNVFSET